MKRRVRRRRRERQTLERRAGYLKTVHLHTIPLKQTTGEVPRGGYVLGVWMIPLLRDHDDYKDQEAALRQRLLDKGMHNPSIICLSDIDPRK